MPQPIICLDEEVCLSLRKQFQTAQMYPSFPLT